MDSFAAHGQWVVGSNPIRVISGVSQPTIIAPVLQRQISHKTHSEKSPIQGYLQGKELLNSRHFSILYMVMIAMRQSLNQIRWRRIGQVCKMRVEWTRHVHIWLR